MRKRHQWMDSKRRAASCRILYTMQMLIRLKLSSTAHRPAGRDSPTPVATLAFSTLRVSTHARPPQAFFQSKPLLAKTQLLILIKKLGHVNIRLVIYSMTSCCYIILVVNRIQYVLMRTRSAVGYLVAPIIKGNFKVYPLTKKL